MSPQHIYCGGCHRTLYYGMEVIPPQEVILKFEGSCPGCGKKLGYDPQRLIIAKYDAGSFKEKGQPGNWANVNKNKALEINIRSK